MIQMSVSLQAVATLCACLCAWAGAGDSRRDAERTEPAGPLFPVEEGWIDQTGKLVIRHGGGITRPFSEGLAPVASWGTTCVVNAAWWKSLDLADGKAPSAEPGGGASPTVHVTPEEYARKVGAGRNPFGLRLDWGLKWGYIDRNGAAVIKPLFDMARPFSEGLAAVTIGMPPHAREGYFVDAKGTIAIDLGRGWGTAFSEGLAYVVTYRGETQKHGFIDKTGKLVIKLEGEAYRWGGPSFSEGLAAVRCGTGECYIDKKGKTVAGPFELAQGFSEGLGAVRVKEKWGYLNRAGKMAIGARFEWAGSFSEGLAPVAAASREDAEGRKVFDKWGYIDKNGDYVVGPTSDFEAAGPFSEGLARVRVGEKFGYIDRTGKLVIPVRFEGARDFSNGLAELWVHALRLYRGSPSILLLNPPNWRGYIDRTGKLIYPSGRYPQRHEPADR